MHVGACSRFGVLLVSRECVHSHDGMPLRGREGLGAEALLELFIISTCTCTTLLFIGLPQCDSVSSRACDRL